MLTHLPCNNNTVPTHLGHTNERPTAPSGGADCKNEEVKAPSLKENSATGTSLILQHVEGVSQSVVGYSPFLSFDVVDLDDTVQRLLILGAELVSEDIPCKN